MTDQIEFQDEPNVPPSFISAPNAPAIGTRLHMDSGPGGVTINVLVRDENVEQELGLHTRIRTLENPTPPFDTSTVPISNSPIRNVPLFINTNQLQLRTCHLLEVAVSASFVQGTSSDFANRDTEDADDIAFATWQIWEGEAATPAELGAIAATCPDIVDLTTPGALDGDMMRSPGSTP